MIRILVRVRGCGWWLRGVPLGGIRSESLGRFEGSAGSASLDLCARRASTGIAAGMLRTDQLNSCPAGSRTLPRGLGRTRGSAAERKKFIENRARTVATLRCCAARKGSNPGATVSGRRLSQRPRRVLRGNPCSWSNSPAPAVDGQNHQHGCWPAATLGSASRSPRNPYFTRPYREAPVAIAQRVRSSEAEACWLSNRSLVLLSTPSVCRRSRSCATAAMTFSSGSVSWRAAPTLRQDSRRRLHSRPRPHSLARSRAHGTPQGDSSLPAT